jgi:N12 class adenine-specific DNA methylase
MKKALFDWPRMTQLTGRNSKGSFGRSLTALFTTIPSGGLWETADRYLSGDVSARNSSRSPSRRNARSQSMTAQRYEALKAVQPADLLPGDISARLGSSWIPASDVTGLHRRNSWIVPKSGGYGQPLRAQSRRGRLALDSYANRVVSQHHDIMAPNRMKATELIEDALNGRTPTVYDQIDKDTRVINQQETLAAREKQQQLKEKFSEWMWQDEERASSALPAITTTRSTISACAPSTALTSRFPGMNSACLAQGDLDKHQKDAVWRDAAKRHGTLLAHSVGAGKTWEITAAAMEMRQARACDKAHDCRTQPPR